MNGVKEDMQIICLNYASHIIGIELIRSKNASVMYALHTWFMVLIQKLPKTGKKTEGLTREWRMGSFSTIQ